MDRGLHPGGDIRAYYYIVVCPDTLTQSDPPYQYQAPRYPDSTHTTLDTLEIQSVYLNTHRHTYSKEHRP